MLPPVCFALLFRMSEPLWWTVIIFFIQYVSWACVSVGMLLHFYPYTYLSLLALSPKNYSHTSPFGRGSERKPLLLGICSSLCCGILSKEWQSIHYIFFLVCSHHQIEGFSTWQCQRSFLRLALPSWPFQEGNCLWLLALTFTLL